MIQGQVMPEENTYTITPETTRNELNAFRFIPLFKKSFDEGAQLKDLLDVTQKGSIASLEENLRTLELKDSLVEQHLYFSLKSLVRETKVWLDLIAKAYIEQKSNAEAESECIQHITPLTQKLDDFNHRLSKFELALVKQRQERLPTDFSEQIKKIEDQMQIILFDFIKTNKNIPLLYFSISKKVTKKITQDLDKFKIFIKKFRSIFEKELIKAGCNLLIEIPNEFIRPILYTKEGNIYLIQESVEHYVGMGVSKNVSRTFEMQNGNIRALICPRKSCDEHLSENENQELTDVRFFTIFIESDLLKEVQGKEGIIRMYEACAFKRNNESLFFQVCELYDSCELQKILYKITSKKKPLPSKESIVAIARDMLCGLISLKTTGLIHRDLKRDNILAHTQTAHVPAGSRIIDFNIACKADHLKAKVKLLLAMISPPELCKVYIKTNYAETSNEYIPVTTYAIDMWAIGLHLYTLFFHKEPSWIADIYSPEGINDKNNDIEPTTIQRDENIVTAMHIAQLKDDWIPQEFTHHVMYPLIKKMLEIDPAKRIAAEDALPLFDKLSQLYLRENIKNN